MAQPVSGQFPAEGAPADERAEPARNATPGSPDLSDSTVADEPDYTETQGIVITGRAEKRIGITNSASDRAISGEELRLRPILRTSELAEAVPGLISVQHSGGGKAAQYYIRGYNLDHGTDFTIAVDGMPMNLRSQAHGQGYLDLNGLIPEIVDRIEYRKGPYRAADGNFSFVASASLSTMNRTDKPFVSVEAGSYGYRRLVGVASGELGPGSLLLAAEFKHNNGVWQLPERLRHASVFGKYTVDTDIGTVRASLQSYGATWQPTEQIPVRAIGTLVPDRFGTLDPFLRGNTYRQIGTLGLESETLSATAYVQHYTFDLFSNFTFFLNDPVNGDELEQTEDRMIYGARVQQRFTLNDRLHLAVGVDAQEDRIDDLGLYQTRFGRRIATTSLGNVKESSLSGYGELRWRPVNPLTLTGGVRYDHFRFRQTALAGAATDGVVNDGIVTPKASAALEAVRGIAFYANYGQGFHSNSARGVTAAVDPVQGLVRGTGYDLGTRIERGPVVFTLDRWFTRSASELVYSSDDGTVSPTGPSRRNGYEATLYVKPARWLAIDAIYATNHARFTDAPEFDRIPNSLESAASLGVTGTWEHFNAALRVRHLGAHPLIEDNRVRAPSTTVVNLRVATNFGCVEVAADLLNVSNTKRADADYFYASRLPGEPLEGLRAFTAAPLSRVRCGLGLRSHCKLLQLKNDSFGAVAWSQFGRKQNGRCSVWMPTSGHYGAGLLPRNAASSRRNASGASNMMKW